jgi:excisionase family DNA binding protein
MIMTEKTYMNFDEAAEYLGVAKTSLYNKCYRKQIPHYKPSGGKLYFLRSELDAWIAAGRVAARNEIKTQANNFITH